MLPKAHLTSHSRMSGPKGAITPSWLSGSLSSFLYGSSVYSCHLLTSSASVRTVSVLYCAHLCMKCSLGISNFLEEISSLSHSIAFLFLCIDHWGKLSYLSLLFFGTLPISPLSFSSLLFSAICKASSDNHFAFLHFFFPWRWFWSPRPVQCHEPPSTVLQALCLSNLLPWIYLSRPLYSCKGFDLGHTWMV